MSSKIYIRNDGNNFCSLHIVKSTEDVAKLVEETITQHDRQEKESSIAFLDVGDVVFKLRQWKRLFPRVKPFYAVKCNDDYVLVKTLVDLGVSFDCASKNEIEQVTNMGVKPSRIIFANPVKHRGHIRYAAKMQVNLMTFDNLDELVKISYIFPDARLVLRLLPLCDVKAQCELGTKFGCHPDRAHGLLVRARELGLNVMGISFHVGSGIQGAEAFKFAIEQARAVFDDAVSMGFDMELLDIGGGFPGSKEDKITIEEIAEVVNEELDKHFPEESGVRIISEPGRYFAASAFTVYCRITGLRQGMRGTKLSQNEDVLVTANDQPAWGYYLNDGVYGSFNCVLYDHAVVRCKPYKETSEDAPRFCSCLWGPTCDGFDVVMEEVELPQLEEGDWIEFANMGAYTLSAGSTFNGFVPPMRIYYCREDTWCQSRLGEDYGVPVYVSPHQHPALMDAQKLQLRAGRNSEDLKEEEPLRTVVAEEVTLAD